MRIVADGKQSAQSAQRDEALIRLIANAHAARKAMAETDAGPSDSLADGQSFSVHYQHHLARLGGLAPDIVTAILEGRQPAGLTRTKLSRVKNLPLAWSDQRKMLGFV
jgi:site-specific DNA recombinase